MTELQAFRNEISNYNFYINQVKKIREQINDQFYMYFGVRGSDPSKLTLENKNQSRQELEMLYKIEKYNKFKKEKEIELKRINNQINYIKRTLNRFDELTRKIFVYIYIYNISYIETCLRLNLVDSKGKPKIGELQYLMKKAFKDD